MLIKLDMHVHSENSFDSDAKLSDILCEAKKKGLSGVAIADHDFFTQHEIPEEFADMIIIPACEYSTDMGHTLVYFLSGDIAKNLKRDVHGRVSFNLLCERAHENDALVFLAHPFAPYFERPESVYRNADGFEAYNARIEHSRTDKPNEKAQSLVIEYNRAFSAGSDAHFPEEVGFAYWQAEVDDSADIMAEIKAALKSGGGEIFGGKASPTFRVKSQRLRMKARGIKFPSIRLLPRRLRAFMHRNSVSKPTKINFMKDE